MLSASVHRLQGHVQVRVSTGQGRKANTQQTKTKTSPHTHTKEENNNKKVAGNYLLAKVIEVSNNVCYGARSSYKG